MESIAKFYTETDAILFIDALVWRGRCSREDCFISKELDGRFHVYLTN